MHDDPDADGSDAHAVPGGDPGDPGASSDATSDAVQAGLEQFQRAVLDAVRAARMMLEAAESLLEEPEAAKTVADTVTAFARTATETVAGFAATAWTSGAAPGTGADGDERRGPDDEPDGGLQRIPVD